MGKYPKIGLVLGGGGARGFAHIGVIKVLIMEDIPIDLIAGSSMGAVVGGSYALLQDIDKIENLARELPNKIPEIEEIKDIKQMPHQPKHAIRKVVSFIKELYVINIEATKKSLVENKKVLPLLEEVYNEHHFSDLKLPFVAVATDLHTGEEIHIQKGKLTDGILASMAVPGIFEPVHWNDHLLVDGSVTSQVPVEAAKNLGADFVIAVNVERELFKRQLNRGIDIMFQVDEIRGAELNRLKLAQSDVVIHPKISHINWFQISKVEECIRCGEEAAMEMIPVIRKQLKKLKRKRWTRFLKTS